MKRENLLNQLENFHALNEVEEGHRQKILPCNIFKFLLHGLLLLPLFLHLLVL